MSRFFFGRKIMKNIFLILLIFIMALAIQAQTVGLVLSGGGARALAQIGVLQVLDSLNVKIDYIVGTSSGAFIGALYSMGYTGKEIEDLLKKTDWENVFQENINRNDFNIAEKRWMPFSKYYFFIDNIYKPQMPKAYTFGENFILKVFDFTYPTYKLKNYDELPVKYRCIATNLLTGNKKIFKSTPLHQAIRSSMAFPAILQPFKIGKEIFIDGGITDNFPVDVMKNDFNPDIILGIRTNTNLKKIDEMASLIDIIKQTVNINIIKKVKEESKQCDILIQPKMQKSFLNFFYDPSIIQIGKNEAIKHISILSNLPKRKSSIKKLYVNKIKFDKIRVIGNRYLSKAKILEYLNLKTKHPYSKNEIIQAFKNAYNTDLFNYIYPVISIQNGKTILKVIEEEKLRKKIGLNFTIRNDDDFSGNVYGIFTNLLQKNSKLILNMKVGTEKELVEDYVKNFGSTWGAYFRIFSSLSEKKFIVYDDSTYFKIRSIRNKSFEFNAGTGIFIKNIIVSELYGFYYEASYSRDIGDYLKKYYSSFGAGIKIYHESLDNFAFPMKGMRILSKYKIYRMRKSRTTEFKFHIQNDFYLKIAKNTSIVLSQELGTMQKDSQSKEYVPFTLGGMDNFLGLNKDEITSTKYLITRFAFRKKIKRVFLDLQFNSLTYKKTIRTDIYAYGLKIGIDAFFGPIKIAVARNDHGSNFLYFSLGYTFDQFVFSRR